MNAETCLEKLSYVGVLSFATVDEWGAPQVRCISAIHYEADRLYFFTARGKDFCRELERDGRVQVMGYTKFKEMIRLSGRAQAVPEEAQVTVTGSCGTARLIRSDGAAAIGVELTLSLLVRTYETVTVAPVTDLYSTRWDTALQRQSLTLTETWPPETVQPEVHQELESRPFLYVTAADCGAVTTGQEGDHTTLRTPLRLRLLYLDESGAPVTAERTDEAAAPVPGDVTTARAACLSPSLRPSGTGLELTVPVELTVERSRRCTWDAITAAELTEPEPGRRPSLVLCRPKKGESLWELAKRYRTDEQAICAANGLEQETPLPSGLLLIPRVR